MKRSVLVLGAFATLSATGPASPPAQAAAGGLLACQADRATAEAEIDALLHALDAANARIDALAAENEALRDAALPSPFGLDDVAARIAPGGGDALDREALGAFATAMDTLAIAAQDPDLAGALLTFDDRGLTVHMLGRDAERNLRSGATLDCQPGGAYTCKAPKIVLNP